MIPHFPGKIRAPPPTTDSGRHTGAIRAPYGRLGAPPSTGSFLLIKHTHTRARVRACVCVGASVRRCAGAGALGAFGPTGDGRRAPGRRCSGAPCGRLGAPRPRGCSLGLSKGARQALCCAQGARWALLGRSSGARAGRSSGRSSGARQALSGARAGRSLGRSSGARQALSGARAGRSLGRSSSAHQARAGRSFWALLGRSSGAHWALRAIILELHGHSMLRQS